MKIQMLPSTIDENGVASVRQHLLSIIIDDRVAIDAGCLAFSCSELQRKQVRDIILTHTHLDHIAGLPIYIDDLFASLTEPVRVHATRKMIDILERDLFNWEIYPRFSDLSNENGPVVKYVEFSLGDAFNVKHLNIRSVPVNHKVSASGYIVSDKDCSVLITGDTAETDDIWDICNNTPDIRAAFVECAFPNEMSDLARVSDHLTPDRLVRELDKIRDRKFPVYILNIKPMYRETVIEQLTAADLPQVEVLTIGKVYEF